MCGMHRKEFYVIMSVLGSRAARMVVMSLHDAARRKLVTSRDITDRCRRPP